MASAAHAGIIAIFDTGVNVSGVPLANGTLGDPHYTLFSVPAGGITALVVRSTGVPIPPWLVADTFSAWIAPNAASFNSPPGNYDYRTTFDLTGFAPDTATLIGKWAMDNSGVNILINGHPTGIAVPALDPLNLNVTQPFQQFNSFSIHSGFVAGLNTLDFIVNNFNNNGANPTGLRVEVTGTAFTPEPGSLVLFGAGFAALCLLRRRLRVN
jgi:hypothetical protein